MAGQAIAPTPFDVQGPAEPPTGEALHRVLFDLGVEPSMTVNEAAAILRWSYWKARRYFSQVEGICVSYRPKRYKRYDPIWSDAARECWGITRLDRRVTSDRGV